MLLSLAVLLLFQCFGEGVSYMFRLPVPGPVVGMLLLLAFLIARPRAADTIEPTANELLRHLSLLFVPAGAGIMASASPVRGCLLAGARAIIVSRPLGMRMTTAVTRAL